jgi:integrase
MSGQNRDIIIVQLEKLLAGNGGGEAGGDIPESFARGTHGALFAGFALRMMSRCGQQGDKFAVPTAKAYVFSAAKRLGGIMGSEDVSGFGPEEWGGLYEELLDDAGSAGMRRKIVRMLREFQAYLEIEHGVDTPDAEELFGRYDGLVPVDANVITPDEFTRIRNRMESDFGDRAHGELKLVGWLVVTLAYRCGLRRMEVLKLELADVCIKPPAELLVRPTEARRLKTKNSTRKIPLYALLESEELERLKV